MKNIFSCIGKTSLSVILSVMMIMSTMLVGTITTDAVSTAKVYFKNTSSWSNPTAYYWGGTANTWPGTAMTSVGNNVYSVDVPTDNTKIIFSNNGSNQTADLFIASGWTTSPKMYNYSNSSWEDYNDTIAAAPSSVVDGTNVMFYIQSYSGGDVGLTNGTSATYKKATQLTNPYGYMNIAKTERTTYNYISNNLGNWNGVQNTGINTANGGELFIANGSILTTVATTAATTLSSSTVIIGSATTVTFNTSASKATSAYNSNLYVQYYVDNTLVNTSNISASTTSTPYTYNISSLSAGDHTVKTVLTDGQVYYIADTDTLTISQVQSHNVSFSATPSAGGTIKVNNTTTSPVSVAEGNAYTVTLTPNKGYEVDTFTVGGTDYKADLTNNTYTGTMGSADVAVAATFKKSNYTVTCNTATNGSVTADKATANYGDTVTLTVTPDAGYQLKSLSVKDASDAAVTVTDNAFTMPASNVTVTATFEAKDPTVTLDAVASDLKVNQSTTLTPNVTVDTGVTYTGTYTIKKDGADVTAADYITNNTFNTAKSAASAGTYVITYSATTSTGTTASSAVTITVTESDEQKAYGALLAGLGTTTYPALSSQGNYTTSSYNAYQSAYTAAQTAVNEGGYPDYNGTANTTAKANLDTAKANLAEKTTLATPTVTVTKNGVLTPGAAVTVTVTNAADYQTAANVTYSLRDSLNAEVGTSTDGTFTLTYALSNAGNYTVVAVAGNSDDFNNSSASTEFAISKTETANISIANVANATVTGSYTDAYGATQTLAEGATAEIPVGNSVSVTVTPDTGYIFDNITYGTTTVTTNPGSVTVNSTDTEINASLHAVSTKTIKLAVASFSDPDNHDGDNDSWWLKDKTVSYVAPSGNGTTTMTANAEGTAYFRAGTTWVGTNWNGNLIKHYIYDVTVPEDATTFTLTWLNGNTTQTVDIDTTTEYYEIYRYASVHETAKTVNDRYYPATVTADHTVDSSATASISSVTANTSGNTSAPLNSDTTKTYYAYNSVLNLTKTVSDIQAYAFNYWTDGTDQFATDTYTVKGNTQLTAMFKNNQSYIVNLVDVDYSTITSSDATAYAGKSVTVTVTPDTGYNVTALSVKDAGNNNVTVTDNGDNTFTFTMPSSAVIVTPTVAQKATYTVTAASGGNGAAAASAATVYEGDTVTFTATPNAGYALSSWTINGTYTITEGSLTSNSVTVKANSDLTATATFNIVDYYLVTGGAGTAGSKKYPLYATSVANIYVSPITVANTNYFTVYDGTKYLTYTGDSSFYFTSSIASCTTTKWISSNSHPFYNNTGAAKYVYYNISTHEISVSSAYSGPASYNVYAKYGTVRDTDGTNQFGNTDLYGVTEITSGTYGDSAVHTSTDKTGTHNSYRTYSAKEGSILTIQTTMNSSYKTAGYYVYAFCVNGKTVIASPKGNGVYEATWQAQSDSSYIEITPVYFNSNIEANNDYITFYVDASQANEAAGNSISCFTYYGSAGNGDGAYPGQPMLLGSDGKYFTKVAKYYYNSDGTKTSTAITGMTLSNYNWDYIHNTIANNGTFTTPTKANKLNRQTYDYNDFVKLAEAGYKTIMFEMQYKDAATHTTNQSKLLSNVTNAPSKSGSTITYSDYSEWKDFTDYFGNKTDILGNYIEENTDGTPTYQSQPIRIVSAGNQSTSVGQWSTEWYVYDWNGKYITQGNSTDFIDSTTAAYSAMNTSAYIGHPTFISYESEQDATYSADTYNTGVRSDGRWYYAKNIDVDCNVSVEYKGLGQDTFTEDADSNSDSNTGWIGTVTGSKASIDGVTTATYSSLNVQAELNATPGSGWVFKGWYIKKSDGTYATVDEANESTTVTISNKYHYVARFEQAPSGSLTLSHSKYGGTDANGGKGYYYIAATVYASDGTTVVQDYAMTDSAITIDNTYFNSTCKIKVTLKTVCAGDNTFYSWYEGVDGDYQYVGPEDTDYRGTGGTVQYTWTIDGKNLFNGSTQAVKSLNYYSDIVPVTGECELTYKYVNRFNEDRSYIVKVKLDDAYIEAHGYTPTNDLIYSNAPAIDDLYKDCKWNLSDVKKVSINGSKATVIATQTKKTYDVQMKYPDVNLDLTVKTVPYTVYLNDFIKDAGGNFINAPQVNSTGQQFSYWIVTDTDKNNEEVAKCYANAFNLRIAGNYTVTAVYGVAKEDSLSISSATYTREQYTEDSVNYDYLYADFIISYMSTDGILLNSLTADDPTYHTGLVVEINQNSKLNVADVAGGTADYSAITFDSDNAQIKTAATTVASGSSMKYTYSTDSSKRLLYNFEADNSKYNNKNRMDFLVKFKNTAAFRQYVMKAYYYVYYTDKTTGEIQYKVTSCQYFNLYEIGNSVQSTDKG